MSELLPFVGVSGLVAAALAFYVWLRRRPAERAIDSGVKGVLNIVLLVAMLLIVAGSIYLRARGVIGAVGYQIAGLGIIACLLAREALKRSTKE